MENGRVFLQNAESTEEEEDTEEDSSESISDSGTDVSELGMFGVPKPQTTLQNTAKPAPAIESEPMSSMARQVVCLFFLSLSSINYLVRRQTGARCTSSPRR